jgi:hypothetical protein
MEVSDRGNPTGDDAKEKAEFVPRGITVFLTLMLILYAAYWAYLWFVVTIQRGTGG